MKKSRIAFLLALIMMLSILPFGASAAKFTDVKSSAYYYDAVQWAVKKNITAGTTSTTFSPSATCTRAQVVTFLWRANGEPNPKTTKNPFKDVKSGAYYYKAVLWAVEHGITAGTSKTTFSPSANCTRGQVVTFLWRNKSEPTPRGANSFLDVNPSNYYYEAVCWAVGRGVTAGADVAAFSPNASCTRAQIVTFLYRDLTKSNDFMSTYTDLKMYEPYLDYRMTSAYAKIVREREKTYGKAAFVGGQWMTGVACVRLIDLNNDGTLELLLWEDTMTNGNPNAAKVEIWTWDGSNAKKLYDGFPLMGGDPSGQMLTLIKMDGQYMLVTGEEGGAIDEEFYAVSGTSMVRKHTLKEIHANGKASTQLDGKAISDAKVKSLIGQSVTIVNVWMGSDSADDVLTETATTRSVLGV